MTQIRKRLRNWANENQPLIAKGAKFPFKTNPKVKKSSQQQLVNSSCTEPVKQDIIQLEISALTFYTPTLNLWAQKKQEVQREKDVIA